MPNGVHFTEADYYRAATEAQHSRQRLNGCRDDLERAHRLLMAALWYVLYVKNDAEQPSERHDQAEALVAAIQRAVR